MKNKDFSIRVISLDDSILRKNISCYFSNINEEFEFFDAIRGNYKKIFDLESSFDKYKRVLSNGEIGCTLSHYYVIKDFLLDSKKEWLIVLEDDAIPTKDFSKFLNNFNLSVSNFPLTYILGHSKTREKDVWVQRLKQPLSNKTNINGYYFGENKRINFCGTVSYMINRSAAELIAKNNSIYWVTDDWSFHEKKGLRIYHPFSPLVYEDLSSMSSTGNKVFYNHDIFNNPLLQVGSILKAQILAINNKMRNK